MAGSKSSPGTGPMAKAYNIDDLRVMARRRLPKVIFDYLDGGADDEVTLRNNRTAFSDCSLKSKMLVDVSDASTKTTVLGQETSSPMEVLPEIVASVGDQLEVLADSGFRRGTDVIQALALGAGAVLIGRPYLYGLSAGGQAGVAQALELLQAEILRDMKLMGLCKVSEITADCLLKSEKSRPKSAQIDR